ncbi:RND family transporter [Halobium salinum]|uniref:RND family transporter n=1 Tax=Halobium salinum TaxID=1364940 RepID=A0ABD5PAT4_9EURY|nr:MMPL family transporter [Halobium salinum]
MRVETVVERVTALVVDRPGAVVAAFLAVTAVFAVGLGTVSTDAGTEGFTEDLPSTRAFEEVTERFSPPFEAESRSTQLVQQGPNVLSKPALLRMLESQERLADDPSFRVVGTSSAAGLVALTLDPEADTADEQVDAVEDATAEEVADAVREAAAIPGFRTLVSDDFNAESATATATVGVVEHDLPGEAPGVGNDAEDPLTPIQLRATALVTPDIVVFGSGVLGAEFGTVIGDSLLVVVPAAVVLIVVFLVYAYRDPVDLLLGTGALAMTLVWTVGFLGLAGIAFSQLLIAVPPLLLAVGIDFGIHAVNRYREERAGGEHPDSGVVGAMTVAERQLLVAFGIVTGTTVIGFAANATSAIGPIRDFGLVSAVGITFTFLVFGVFLPAAKVWVDERRVRYGLPTWGTTPLGKEGSALGAVLPVGVAIAARAPTLFLALVLVSTAGIAAYGTGVDTAFSQEDFLPPAETPAYLRDLPEPFRPSEYTATRTIDLLEGRFETAQDDTVTLLVEGRLDEPYALPSIERAGRDPPDSFVREGRNDRGSPDASGGGRGGGDGGSGGPGDGRDEGRGAVDRSVADVIRGAAAADPGFAAVVAESDLDGDGLPDENVRETYDALMASPAGDEARRFLTDDYRYARVEYQVKSDAPQDRAALDAVAVAERHRLPATATGELVVFKAVSDLIFASAVESLVIALALTAVFLVLVYRVTAGRGSLGVVNLVPILVSIACIAGTMRYFGVPFNALTATVLSVALGLGIDYSAHLVHRFADEFDARDDALAALSATARGTGGALTASVLTTAAGVGTLTLALTPILGQFGLVVAVSVVYSYLASLVVTPSAVMVWARLTGARGRPRTASATTGADGPVGGPTPTPEGGVTER